jgi:GT2 family glycosyltransferase
MSTGSRVAVVVVSYNSAANLPGFFRALAPALEGIDEAAVVLSDNASHDDSIAVARDVWQGLIVVSSPTNRGYAAAINAGAAAVPLFDSLLVLNDDIRLAPGSVASLIGEFDSSDVGVVVPRLVDGDGELLKSQRRSPTITRVVAEAVLGGDRAGRHPSTSEIVQSEAQYATSTDVTWASGCAWLISRSCWDLVGLWDESLFLYGEDLDYALRVGDAGLRIRYTPEAEAIHLVGPSHRDPRLWSMLVWNRYRVYRRRHGPLRSAMFRGGLILNEGIRAALGSPIHRAALGALLVTSRRPPEVRGA